MQFRKRNRLEFYDYSWDGFYFVTICTKNRKNYFGEISNGKMILNKYGEIVEQAWKDLPEHYKNCILDTFTIMPNHVHGIVIIDNYAVVNGLKPFTTHGLSEIMQRFKTFSSLRINRVGLNLNFHWQKSFYDHIIRSETSLHKIREYILTNPLKWSIDKENLDKK